jgi:hypothetical protein
MIMKAPRTSLLRSFLLAATLAIGFGTLWLVLASWIGNSVLEASRDKSQLRQESLVVATDGTPLIESTPLQNLSMTTYRDLSGNARDGLERRDTLWATYVYGADEDSASSLSQPNWQQRIKVFRDEREPAVVWYFVHDGQADGSGYFVGYERVSNRRVGYIGLSGFRADPVPPGDRIPVRGRSILGFSAWSSAPISLYSNSWWGARPDRWDFPPRLVHVPSGSRLRLVDLAARTVATVLETAEPVVSVGVPSLASYAVGESSFPRPILVGTPGKVYKLDHDYKVVGTFAIPADVDRQGLISWYETRDGQSIVQCVVAPSAREVLDGNSTRSMIYRLASDGTIRDSQPLSLQTVGVDPREQTQESLVGLAIPAPAVLVAVGTLVATLGPQRRDPSPLGAMLKQAWPALLAVVVVSSLLAAVAWRWARAYGLSAREQGVWAGFVLLFGLPAFVGFLIHRRWPVRAACPNCHARSPRDREACAECGALFPAPAPKGIEIFA